MTKKKLKKLQKEAKIRIHGYCGGGFWKVCWVWRIQFWDGAYFVRRVFVAKPFRRRGLGSKLLEKCEELVRKKDETSIYLSVEPKHSVSIDFLIHNGYDTINMLELRKDFTQTSLLERQGEVAILGHRLRLLRRKT